MIFYEVKGSSGPIVTVKGTHRAATSGTVHCEVMGQRYNPDVGFIQRLYRRFVPDKEVLASFMIPSEASLHVVHCNPLHAPDSGKVTEYARVYLFFPSMGQNATLIMEIDYQDPLNVKVKSFTVPLEFNTLAVMTLQSFSGKIGLLCVGSPLSAKYRRSNPSAFWLTHKGLIAAGVDPLPQCSGGADVVANLGMPAGSVYSVTTPYGVITMRSENITLPIPAIAEVGSSDDTCPTAIQLVRNCQFIEV